MTISKRNLRALALSGAGLIGAILCAPQAGAQPVDRDAAVSSRTEEVIVTAPRYQPRRSEIGAAIEDVSLSREVRFDDLDLRTAWGARELRERVRTAAHTLCRQLETQYLVVDDNPSCYSSAVGGAIGQTDAAIHEARLEAARE